MAALTWACNTLPPFAVSGVVLNEIGGAPIAGAHVELAGLNASTTANSDGGFQLSYPLSTTGHAVMNVSAPGFATRSYLYEYSSAATTVATLRPVDQTWQITLPGDQDDALQFPLMRGDGGTTLTIPPSALVTPDGSAATGIATVSMTYWHPQDSLRSAPGALVASPNTVGGTPIPLETYGMTEITIDQNGILLQVAPGKTLPLQFNVPTLLSERLLVTPRELQPNLYYLNRTTGLWDLSATQADGSVVLDQNSGLVTAQLPHLSAWNLDGLALDKGGCLAGQIKNLCGLPAQKAAINLWIMAWEELVQYPVTTDTNGNYCINVGTTDIDDTHTDNLTHYYIAAASDINNSDQCHAVKATPSPIPAPCMTCATSDPTHAGQCCRYQIDYEVPDGVCSFNDPTLNMAMPQSACGGCDNTGDTSFFAPGPGAPGTYTGTVLVGFDDCHTVCDNIPETDIQPCNFCSGSASVPGACWAGNVQVMNPVPNTANCSQLITVTIDDGTDCTQVGPGNPDPCATNAARLEGQPCDTTTVCCPAAAQLVCADQVCVPNTDPGL